MRKKIAEASFPERKKVRKILVFPDFLRSDTILGLRTIPPQMLCFVFFTVPSVCEKRSGNPTGSKEGQPPPLYFSYQPALPGGGMPLRCARKKHFSCEKGEAAPAPDARRKGLSKPLFGGFSHHQPVADGEQRRQQRQDEQDGDQRAAGKQQPDGRDIIHAANPADDKARGN